MTLCPTVYVEGSGELIGAAYRLGTAHPTGYPLFCLSSRLLAYWRCCGLVRLWRLMSHRPCLPRPVAGSWRPCSTGAECSPVVALAAALALAFSRTFWSQAVIAEVYGLALLLVVLVRGSNS